MTGHRALESPLSVTDSVLSGEEVHNGPMARTHALRPPRAPRFRRPQSWPLNTAVPAGNRTLVFLAFVASLAFWTAALATTWLPEVTETRHYIVAAMFVALGAATLVAARYLYMVLVLGRGRRRA